MKVERVTDPASRKVPPQQVTQKVFQRGPIVVSQRPQLPKLQHQQQQISTQTKPPPPQPPQQQLPPPPPPPSVSPPLAPLKSTSSSTISMSGSSSSVASSESFAQGQVNEDLRAENDRLKGLVSSRDGTINNLRVKISINERELNTKIQDRDKTISSLKEEIRLLKKSLISAKPQSLSGAPQQQQHLSSQSIASTQSSGSTAPSQARGNFLVRRKQTLQTPQKYITFFCM